MSDRILIVDDDAHAVENLAHVCRKEGYEVVITTQGQEALDLLEHQYFELVLSDLRIDQIDGIEILQQAKQQNPDVEVILITGFASFETAVTAMKAGAFHYVAKPFRLDEVRELIRKALSVSQLKIENRALRHQLADQTAPPSIISQDPNMKQVLETARQVATTNSNILITGESGTGKELLARYIHAHSSRKQQNFHAINCGALPEELLASELFGHEEGAFTGASARRAGLFEAAQGGTVFLDEIGEMSPLMQVKLLRIIQEREVQPLGGNTIIPVEFRLITATNRDLQQEVREENFRQDLFYRINVIQLHLPPLSARLGDIPLLAQYFLHTLSDQRENKVVSFSPEAMSRLQSYSFPGNIRQLQNAVEYCAAVTLEKEISINDLPSYVKEGSHSRPPNLPTTEQLPTLAERESEYIQFVMEYCNGNRTHAATILGIDRVSLWRKLKQSQSS